MSKTEVLFHIASQNAIYYKFTTTLIYQSLSQFMLHVKKL